MMRRADAAMYAAKRLGRNCVSAHSEPIPSPGGSPGGADVDSLKLLPTG
jgi:hypothetical protein